MTPNVANGAGTDKEPRRKLGKSLVPPIGLGCMNLSHAYGVPPSLEVGRSIDARPEKLQEDLDNSLRRLPEYRQIADAAGCTAAQLSLAWVLRQGEHVHAIPGTTSVAHLVENVCAANTVISDDIAARLDALINPHTVSGARYPAATQAEIDTEEFPLT